MRQPRASPGASPEGQSAVTVTLTEPVVQWETPRYRDTRGLWPPRGSTSHPARRSLGKASQERRCAAKCWRSMKSSPAARLGRVGKGACSGESGNTLARVHERCVSMAVRETVIVWPLHFFHVLSVPLSRKLQ